MCSILNSSKPAANFDSCPAEIHVAIAEHSSFSAVRSLCFTSKRLSDYCIPVLYRHVDLSFHNRGQLDFTYRRGVQMDYEPYGPDGGMFTPITPNFFNRPDDRTVRIAFEL